MDSNNPSPKKKKAPLTEEQKESLLQALFVKSSAELQMEKGEADISVTYPLESIEARKNDPEAVKRHEDAKSGLQAHADTMARLKQKYPCKEPGLKRLAMYLLNPDDTKEAKDENENLMKSLQTPAGVQSVVNRLVKECMEADPEELVPTNIQDMSTKYLADPMKYQRFWALGDLLSNQKQGNYQIEEPILTAFENKRTLMQKASVFATAAELMADDQWALLSEDSISADQWTKFAGTCVLNASDQLFSEEERKLFAGMGQKTARLSDALKSEDSLKAMQEKQLLGDSVKLKWNGTDYTRSEMADALSNGSVPSLDSVQVTHSSAEEQAQLANSLANLSTDATEIARQRSKAESAAALKNTYQEMLDYHAPSFTAAQIALPTLDELQKKSEDPAMKAVHERAKSEFNEYDIARTRLENQFPPSSNIPDPFKRFYRYLLDTSGTPEALEYNRQLQAVSGTAEGQQTIVNKAVKLLMEKPDDFFVPKNISEAATRYCEDPAIFQLAWVAGNINEALKTPGIEMDPVLKEAFISKKTIFEGSSAFQNAAIFMARDDWAVFDSVEIQPENYLMLAAERKKRGMPANDRYRAEPLPEEESAPGRARNVEDEFGTLYGFRFSESGIQPLMTTGQQLLEADSPFFKNGTTFKIDGKSVSANTALLHKHTKQPEKLEIIPNPQAAAQVGTALSELPIDIMGIAAQKGDSLLQNGVNAPATMGKPLQEDMKRLYQQLDGVNHGFFISSNEFNQVIRATKSLSEVPPSSDKAKEAFDKIIEFGEQYISKKADKQKFSAREQARLDAVKAAVQTAKERSEALEFQHARAEGAHENFQREFQIQDQDLKTDKQLRREELNRTARKDPQSDPEAEAERLSAKFSIEGVERTEDFEPVPPLSKEQIADRIRDPKRMELHNRAKAVQKYLKNVSFENNIKYDMGIADADINRISSYFMDYSGTPEAEEHNRLIGASISTPEGCKALISRMAHMLLTDPAVHDAMTASTFEEAISAYEKNPLLCDMAFNATNITSLTNYLDEPLKTAYKDQVVALEGAKFCQTSVLYVSSDVYLAYEDFDFDFSSGPYLNNLCETLRATNPEDKQLAGAIPSLSVPVTPQLAMTQLLKNDLLKLENEFSDSNGKHLTTFQVADKIANNKFNMDGIYCTKRADADKLPQQIEQLNVGEPISYGREVLDGKKGGSLGHVTDSHFNERIDDIIQIFDNVSQYYPGCYVPVMDEATDYLRSLKIGENEKIDPIQAKEKFEQIKPKMIAWHDSVMETKNQYQGYMAQYVDGLCNAFYNASSLAERCERKADFLQKHEAYELTHGAYERGNGAYRFVTDHVLGEKAMNLSDTVKDIMQEFVVVSEQNYGKKLTDLPKTEQSKFTDGLACALLINQLEMEKARYGNEKTGPVSKLFQPDFKTMPEYCQTLSKNKDFSALCSDVLRNPQKMNTLLSSTKEMDKTLEKCVNTIEQKSKKAEAVNVKQVSVEQAEKSKNNAPIVGGNI